VATQRGTRKRGGEPGESKEERLDRELIELLNELRVALPGVQVLFAFLLTVPFAQGFTTVTSFQKDLYVVVLLCTAVSAALLIAPSAFHRMLFRRRGKEELVFLANYLAIAGLAFLALAMTGAVLLITDFLLSTKAAIWLTVPTGLVFLALWYIAPLLRRAGTKPD
jgi:hypothetical protein